jgi:23S rRNA pseudouridine2457 synthase
MLIALNKPYDVLSQFTPELPGQRTLAEFGLPKEVYPIGRLDRDSEGLLLLTNERAWVDRLLNPQGAHPRIYEVLVERVPAEAALAQLARGVVLEGRPTLPCKVRRLDPPPEHAPRIPPVRFRKNVPDCWLELRLIEGRNRQVRRMTAAVGHPTLRLIRSAIGGFRPADLPAGSWRELSAAERDLVLRQA